MIIAAAIRQIGGPIYIGRRHHEIIKAAKGKLKRGEQGFISDGGKFVTRNEAAKIAFECGQIPKLWTMLFSEDLW